MVAGLLKTGFKAMDAGAHPAFILYVQTFGDLVTFNLHIHALVAEGEFCRLARFGYCHYC